MNKLHSKMTTEELADFLGVTRQTVNRWVREEGWRTEAMPGVKGGRARLIHIDPPVIQYLSNVPRLRHLSLAEPAQDYFVADEPFLWRQIAETLQMMTREEQQQLHYLLAREGISGFLQRLGIASEK